MGRHTLSAVAMAGALAAGAWQGAESGTFVLTNGTRIDGTLPRGNGRGVIKPSSNEFLVRLTDGRDFPLTLSQIAYVDFAGGAVPASEFNLLPSVTGHLLTRRDGRSSQGQLVDFINGDTVRFTIKGGGTETVRIRDVSRIFINIDASQRLIGRPGNAQPPPSTPARGGRSTVPPQQSQGRGGIFGRLNASDPEPDKKLDVRAALAWTSTGLRVRAGEMMRFTAMGQILFGNGPDQNATPDGSPHSFVKTYPVPDMGSGGLIARVDNGKAFPIGSNTEPVRMPATGLLYLGINDDNHNDNSGVFQVTIRR